MTLRTIAGQVRNRVLQDQGGCPTFYDNHVIHLTKLLDGATAEDEAAAALALGPEYQRSLRDAIALEKAHSAGRFVSFSDRRQVGRGIDTLSFLMSQGVRGAPTWRGLPIFKTAYEMALYPMLLWELKPQTIVEIGSGSGGSAVWFADQAAILGLNTEVVSLDIRPPRIERPKVTFLGQDVANLDDQLLGDMLRPLPRPWLVIEDAHVNVVGVLNFIHGLLEVGDYLVVEDSDIKRAALETFLGEHALSYFIDTKYADYFGLNTTSAGNSMFVFRDAGACAP